VITGLYTILLPMSLFAIFGSSRHLAVGADSATAAVVAAGLAGMAVQGSSEWLALCSLLALMAAALMFLARVMRLGFLADFLSRTVLTGFLTGVGVQVSLLEVSGLLGLPRVGNDPLVQIVHDLRLIGETNPYALSVALAVLTVIIGGKRISEKIPGGLIAVLAAIAASWALNLGAHLETLGAVPSGLPTLGLPHVEWSWRLIQKLLPIAFACFVVILAQSAATSRAYAAKYSEPPSTAITSMRTWTWLVSAWPTWAPASPAPLSSIMAARPTRRWSIVAGVAARFRSSPPAFSWFSCSWSFCFSPGLWPICRPPFFPPSFFSLR